MKRNQRPSLASALVVALAVGLCVGLGFGACERRENGASADTAAPGNAAPGSDEAAASSPSGSGGLDDDGTEGAPLAAADDNTEGSGTGDREPPTEAPPPGLSATPCGAAPDGMACVPGGWFTRGVPEDPHTCDQADQPPSGRSSVVPEARVWVDTFYIDVTEVTNDAYQACVGARNCPAAGPSYRDFDAPRQPVTGLDWFQARTFCEARGQRLPTDAEWEKAARGPDGDWYPWGSEPATCDNTVLMNEAGRACGVAKRGQHPETGRISEVCSRPPGRYGLCDMVGNAEEWVSDWWSEDYAECGEACSQPNPRGPCDGADECPGHRFKSIRGGSWYWPAEHATGWHRRRYPPTNQPAHHFGFRCAVSAVELAAR